MTSDIKKDDWPLPRTDLSTITKYTVWDDYFKLSVDTDLATERLLKIADAKELSSEVHLEKSKLATKLIQLGEEVLYHYKRTGYINLHAWDIYDPKRCRSSAAIVETLEFMEKRVKDKTSLNVLGEYNGLISKYYYSVVNDYLGLCKK